MGDELNSVDKQQKTSSVKSHEEILELFEEIEQIEQELKNPDFTNELQESISSEEKLITPESAKDNTVEISEKNRVKKKKSLKILFTPGEKKKTKKIKAKKILKRRKSSKSPSLKKKILKKNKNRAVDKKKSLDPSKSTFTLKLDTSGTLVGLEVPKTKKPKQKFSLKTVFKKKPKKTDDTASKSSDVKGIKALPIKLKGLLSHLPFISKKISNKDTSTSDSSSSKLSAIPKKIKGIFSRK